MRFTGKTAIVTGAGQGIGLAICKQLVKEGGAVLLNDVDSVPGEQAVTEILRETSNGQCIFLPGDAADHGFIRQMVERAVAEFGSLDIVIANAGVTLFGDFFSYPPDSFSRVMQLNLGGTFFLAQAAANQIRKQASGGAFLFMSSVTGHQAHKQLAAYGMSKAAIEMLARNLVIELSPFNINVNCIAPGATLTERTMQDPSYRSTWEKLTPMARPAAVEDIANAALFLVSPEARHITGQTLIVDGGWTSISPSPF